MGHRMQTIGRVYLIVSSYKMQENKNIIKIDSKFYIF